MPLRRSPPSSRMLTMVLSKSSLTRMSMLGGDQKIGPAFSQSSRGLIICGSHRGVGMRRMKHRIGGLLLAAVLAGVGRGASAADNDACPGNISSAGLTPVPKTASFDVENFGNPAN